MEDDRDEQRGLLRQGSRLPREAVRAEPTVPVAYAEKTMSSLLRLHEDLVEEKERRIDLYRRLMDREQELAELRAYVKLLEGEMARGKKESSEERVETTPQARDPVQEAPRMEAVKGDGGGPTIAWFPANLRRTGR